MAELVGLRRWVFAFYPLRIKLWRERNGIIQTLLAAAWRQFLSTSLGRSAFPNYMSFFPLLFWHSTWGKFDFQNEW